MAQAPMFLGQHRVVRQVPLFHDGPAVKWWAERGRVHYEDERDGAHGSIRWQSAVNRVDQLSLALPILEYDRTAQTRLRKFIQQMKEFVIPEARAHGGYFDTGVAESWWDRRPKSVVMPVNSERLVGQSPTLRDLLHRRSA